MPALFPNQTGDPDDPSNDFPGSLREQLKSLVENKEKQLVLVGTLGQRFLTQQVELEERIQQMDDDAAADDSRTDGLRAKLADLASTMKSWESENQQMWATALSIGAQMTAPGDPGVAPSSSLGEMAQSFNSFVEDDFAPPPDSGPSAVQSSRRAKNAGIHRPNTVGELDWYEDIGNQLTREIRRVQALLSERDKALQDLKEERDDLDRNLEALRAALREREAAAERFKDENWNLEYQVQELQSKLADAQSDKQRAEAEHKRTLKQLSALRESADSHKTEAERLQASFDDLKAKHETDIAQMRKTTAGLQREKSDLQTALEGLKADVAQKTRVMPNHFGSPVTPTEPSGFDDDVFTGGNSRAKQRDTSTLRSPNVDTFETSPDPSPLKDMTATPNHHSVHEVDALKQSLAHAHRQLSSLRNSVQREKELKLEYRRRLAQEGGASLDWEDEDVAAGSPSLRSSRLTSGHRNGRISRRRSPKLTLAQKLGMAAAERALEDVGSPDYPSLHQDILDEGDDDEPSAFIGPGASRPTSVDGMDPDFANVLRASDLVGRNEYSPVNQSAFSRRARGGATFGAEPRPISLVEATPAALSAELGAGPPDDFLPLNDEELFDYTAYGYSPGISVVEIGIQCEPDDHPAPLKRMTLDEAVQCDPTDSSPCLTCDASVQFSPAVTVSVSMQTEATPVPILNSISVGTVPEPMTVHVDVATYAPPPPMWDAGAQTENEKLGWQEPIPVIVEPQQQILPTALDVAVPRASFYGRHASSTRPVAMLFEEESENETETESEYVDARETEPTPSSSIQDFHSFQDGGETSDAESVRTSIAAAFVRGIQTRSRHDSHATTRATIVPPKPEMKEATIQTDPWSPTALSASTSSTITFQRGGTTQPFQFIPPSPVKATMPSLALAASVVKSPVRESASGRARTTSISSNGEHKHDGSASDDITSSSLSSIANVDRTRPPTMSLPPPPSMPPPSTIPIKKASVPPARPTSPPPPELVQRATTPTFGRQSSLMVPLPRAPRQSFGNQPTSAPLRHPASVASFRSTSNGGTRGVTRSGPPPSTFIDPTEDKRHMSQTSLISGYSGPPSRRPSVASSLSSGKVAGTNAPQTPSNAITSSTDPAVIHSITQTMIGEFLYKYTRRVVGKGHGEKRHKRFFWVHPYTKTLYWSSADPGASNVGESNAKSAYIDAVKQVIDPNPLPPGLHQYSIIVYTPQREMKFTAPTKERHEIWFKALSYLLDRPSAITAGSPAGATIPASPVPLRVQPGGAGVGEDGVLRSRNAVMASPASVRSALSNESMGSWNLTPRARGGNIHLSPTSVGRRAGTPAAEYLRTYSEQNYRAYPDAQSPTRASRSLQQRFEDALDYNDDDEFENVDPNSAGTDFEMNIDGGYEGLENVRACCDGEHDLNHLAKGHYHHHHSNHAALRPSSRLSNRSRTEPLSPSSRPVSPSAFSGRSRSGSQRSDGASLFNIRFGSKRSTKSSAPPF